MKISGWILSLSDLHVGGGGKAEDFKGETLCEKQLLLDFYY